LIRLKINNLKNLRQASEADIPVIAALADRIWRAHYPDIISTEQIDYMLDWMYAPSTLLRQMTEEGHVFWLPEAVDGTVMGFIGVSQKEPGHYFLHKFYLDNTVRGLGTGSLAFQALLAQYPDLRTLRLTVNRRNYKSINFYFKMGFHIEQCVDIPIGNGYVMDDFQMLLKIDSI
jgi:diamine N-acetyltransferase